MSDQSVFPRRDDIAAPGANNNVKRGVGIIAVMVIVIVAVVDWLPLLLPWPFARCRFLAACVWMPMYAAACVCMCCCVLLLPSPPPPAAA